MMKFGAPLAERTSAAGQLGAAFLLALGLVVACGNDIPDSPGGDAGRSGRGNSAGRTGKGGEGAEAGEEEQAGAAGSSGNAGDSSVPETGGSGGKAGASASGGTIGSTGGSGGKGGTGGGTAGGGTGGSGTVCGNGKVETGEACDDGNTKFGDQCSPTCTNICETCEKDVCGADQNQFYDYCFGDGFTPGTDVAKTGPKAGTKKNALCPALVACLKRTGCSQYDQGSLVKKCYCGTATAADCKDVPGAANGPCAEEIAAAGESRAFNDLSQRQQSPQYALGVANVHYALCDGGVCASECVLGQAQNACQRCTSLQTPEVTSACFVNPLGDPKMSPELCTAAVECIHRAGCAKDGLISCYGVIPGATLDTPGPCATELTAASKGKTPSEIKQIIGNPDGLTPLSAAANEILQELTFCADECFPVASGGSGGSGNASSGGKGGTSGTGG